jgi:hypothetical protein
MRNLSIILGIVLIALGTLVVSGRPTIKSERNVLEVGEFKAAVSEEERLLPPWVGLLAIGGGVALLVAGARKPRSAS